MKKIALSIEDLQRAADEGIIAQSTSEELIRWATERFGTSSPSGPEQAKGLNLVTVAYYFGAMLMISACGWFLGNVWGVLGSAGVLITAVIYAVGLVLLGVWLRARGYLVGGGLLVIVAVCLVPLITYAVEVLLGFWPADDPGMYSEFYPRIHGSWIVMELATVAASLVALKFVRFGFLTAPLAFSLWFFSMDIAALILGNSLNWNTKAWISVAVGLVTIVIGYGLDKTIQKPAGSRSEDFAFWCYLFGLMAFWGGLTSMDSDSEIGKALYAVVNIGLIGVALWLRRAVFVVFGAVGVHAYLGHLAYTVFEDSFLFPFVLAGLGLSLIIVTVLAQRYLSRLSKLP